MTQEGRAISVHLELGLSAEHTYRPGPPFRYEGEPTISVHLDDARAPLDDVAINGAPDQLDRLATALHQAAATARASATSRRAGKDGG